MFLDNKISSKKNVNTSAVVIKNIASSVHHYLALHNRIVVERPLAFNFSCIYYIKHSFQKTKTTSLIGNDIYVHFKFFSDIDSLSVEDWT